MIDVSIPKLIKLSMKLKKVLYANVRPIETLHCYELTLHRKSNGMENNKEYEILFLR